MEVTIDGRKLTLEGPVTVLEAAGRLGIDIPTLCWHPRVSILGACRLCMIEVEGINRLLAACTTQVSDGMSILTDTPQLRKVRQTMLELLLCRHPLDCPTCVKGGDCELQNLAYRHSDPKNRFPENPAPYPVSDPSPFVERDPKKCVLCRRCVRVCREVRGRTVLGAMHRGYHKQVGTYFQMPLDSDFQGPYNCESCGSCINICPVGALNSKVRKFRARTWEGTKTDSVCPFCSVGCTLTLQAKEGELAGSTPRPGPNNQDQACFRGRFATDYVNSTSRLVAPLLATGGRLVPVDRGEAISFVAGKIGEAASTVALISSSLTREEAAAAAEFVTRLCPGGSAVAVDTLGMVESGAASLSGGSWEDLEGADLVLTAGQDFSVSAPVAGVRVRVARRAGSAPLVVLDGRDDLLGVEADLWLRPVGAAIPMLLGAVLRTLAANHRDRLKAGLNDAFLAGLPGGDGAETDALLGLPAGAVADVASRLAGAHAPVLLTHRGWHDPQDLTPAILSEIGRLLRGEPAGGCLFLTRDCNSRGAAALGSQLPAEAPDLVLAFGADPLGNALPGSPAAEVVGRAGTTIVFDTFVTSTAAEASAVMPMPHFAEKSGTFEACNGLIQPLSHALEPVPGVVSLADTLGEIAGAMGRDFAAPAVQGQRGEAARGEAAAPQVKDFPSLPGGGEAFVVLRATAIADHRVRLVPESERLFPGGVVEIHPSDLAARGLEDGAAVEIVSGGARLRRTVREDLGTPPGQVHLPLDPEDGAAVSFAARSEHPEGWPATLRRLTALEKASGGEGEGRQ